MIAWFEKIAPIRIKFRALLIINACISSISALSAFLAYAGFGVGFLAISIAAIAATMATLLISGRMICTPYVNTVVRMEALAQGDVHSPIAYTDHEDCVGRMTKAMSIFRDNLVREANQAKQEEVVRELATGLEHLASGNLTYRIENSFDTNYEKLRSRFNQAVERLGTSLSSVSDTSRNLHTGASEIRTASEDLAHRTEQQAASLEETAEAMNQVATMVAESAKNADEIRTTIGAVHSDVTEGGNIVKNAVSAMDEIEKSSREISQIISIIDGISFQTNLLALNAGVEAARAGDAGKGFAVVANEVRALAQRSADAAKDIKSLITTSGKQVHRGVELVGETGMMLERIVTKISDVNKLIGEMAESTETQSANLQQVNGSVSDLDGLTQQNAAMVEQTTAAARSLSSEADELEGLVCHFKLPSQRNSSDARRTENTTVNKTANKLVSPHYSSVLTSPRPAAKTIGSLALTPDEEDWSDF